MPRFTSVGLAVQFLFTLYNNLVFDLHKRSVEYKTSFMADLHTQIRDSISPVYTTDAETVDIRVCTAGRRESNSDAIMNVSIQDHILHVACISA